MVLDPIPQSLSIHFFGSRPQPPTSPMHRFTTHTQRHMRHETCLRPLTGCICTHIYSLGSPRCASSAGVMGLRAVGKDQKKSRMARIIKGKGSDVSSWDIWCMFHLLHVCVPMYICIPAHADMRIAGVRQTRE